MLSVSEGEGASLECKVNTKIMITQNAIATSPPPNTTAMLKTLARATSGLMVVIYWLVSCCSATEENVLSFGSVDVGSGI